MKQLLLSFLTLFWFYAKCQKEYVFAGLNFDSNYKIVALASSYSRPGKDVNEYSFLVDNVQDLDRMKKDWMLGKPVPKISTEAYGISIFVIKGKQIVDSRALIYPQQGVINTGNQWFEFDMKKFNQTQIAHPLKYRSQTFTFNTYEDFVFFQDSVYDLPSLLLLFQPAAPAFEGSFTIDVPSSVNTDDNPIFVLHDLNKELEKLSPPQKFRAGYVSNDSINLQRTGKVRIKVESAKALYEAYQNKRNEKGVWTPATFNTKLIFRE